MDYFLPLIDSISSIGYFLHSILRKVVNLISCVPSLLANITELSFILKVSINSSPSSVLFWFRQFDRTTSPNYGNRNSERILSYSPLCLTSSLHPYCTIYGIFIESFLSTFCELRSGLLILQGHNTLFSL